MPGILIAMQMLVATAFAADVTLSFDVPYDPDAPKASVSAATEQARRALIRQWLDTRSELSGARVRNAVEAALLAESGRFAEPVESPGLVTSGNRARVSVMLRLDTGALAHATRTLLARAHPRAAICLEIDSDSPCGAKLLALDERLASQGRRVANAAVACQPRAHEDVPIRSPQSAADRRLVGSIRVRATTMEQPIDAVFLVADVSAELAHADGRLVRQCKARIESAGRDQATACERLAGRAVEHLGSCLGASAAGLTPSEIPAPSRILFRRVATTSDMRAGLEVAGLDFIGAHLTPQGLFVPVPAEPGLQDPSQASARWVKRLDGAADGRVTLRAQGAHNQVEVEITRLRSP